MIDLYRCHSHPEVLIGYANRLTTVHVVALRHAIEMKARFPEGEAAIARDCKSASTYAMVVLKGRFPEGEATIMKCPGIAAQYANYCIKDRWPEAEPVILKDAYASFYYATEVMEDRWPEAEAIIKTNDELWELYLESFGDGSTK